MNTVFIKYFLTSLLLMALCPHTCTAKEARNKKRVLIGAPIKQKVAILNEFLRSLEELDHEDYDADYLFIDDNDSAESSFALLEFYEKNAHRCLIMQNKSERNDLYICNETTHYWNEHIIWKVAAFKDYLIEHALEHNYDYLFLVDSDVVLHPKTVDHLITLEKDVVSNIFWTEWQPNSPKLPQVWLYDEYKQYHLKYAREALTQEEMIQRMKGFLMQMATPGTYEVGGLGACTLISKNALEMGVNFKRIKNITFWGEDRHFCVRAAVLGIELFVDTHYPAFHIYRETYLSDVETFKENCRNGIYQI